MPAIDTVRVSNFVCFFVCNE